MRFENQTPFEAACHAVKNKDGEDLFFIGIKASYDFDENGFLKMSEQQVSINMTDEYLGEPGKSSLKIASDFSFNKTNTDIILLGHAYITNHSNTESYVYFKTEGLSYLVKVFGDRHWKKRLGMCRISSPKPFKKIPLSYERSFGGFDTRQSEPDKIHYEMRNPVGRGFSLKKSIHSIQDRPLPNFESPNHFIKNIYEKPEPAGFGYIAPSWSQRAIFAGTYDEKWRMARMPKLPKDFDSGFFNVAHPGLIYPGFMKGSENITLVGVSERGKINFTLPDVKPLCSLKNSLSETFSLPLKLDRMIIDSDCRTITLLWSSTYKIQEDFREVEYILCEL